MSTHASASHPTPTAYRCESCSRAFISVGDSTAALTCPCGGDLVARALDASLYEVLLVGRAAPKETSLREVSPTAPVGAPTGRASDPSDGAGLPTEADVGYGASHGYDATHGGPTGPGDAPASHSDAFGR